MMQQMMEQMMSNPQMMEEVNFGFPLSQSLWIMVNTTGPHGFPLSLSVQMVRNHPMFAGNPQAAEMVNFRRRGGREGGEGEEGRGRRGGREGGEGRDGEGDLNFVANDEYRLVHVAIRGFQ